MEIFNVTTTTSSSKYKGIGIVVAELREERGWTQKEVAEKSEGAFDYEWYASFEHRRFKKIPEPEILECFARIFGVGIEDILERAGIISADKIKLPPNKKKLLEIFTALDANSQRIALTVLEGMKGETHGARSRQRKEPNR